MENGGQEDQQTKPGVQENSDDHCKVNNDEFIYMYSVQNSTLGFFSITKVSSLG